MSCKVSSNGMVELYASVCLAVGCVSYHQTVPVIISLKYRFFYLSTTVSLRHSLTPTLFPHSLPLSLFPLLTLTLSLSSHHSLLFPLSPILVSGYNLSLSLSFLVSTPPPPIYLSRPLNDHCMKEA